MGGECAEWGGAIRSLDSHIGIRLGNREPLKVPDGGQPEWRKKEALDQGGYFTHFHYQSPDLK